MSAPVKQRKTALPQHFFKHRKKQRAFEVDALVSSKERESRKKTKQDAAAAVDAMHAARPLVPPPLRADLPAVVSAGRRALQRDKRLGAYADGFSFETRAGRRNERGRL